MKHLIAVLLLASLARAQGTITHVIYVIKENRSTDELFGTFPGVQNYCQGGNSPKRCTNNQAISCTTLGTHDVCGNAGWCEPIMCTTPTGPECSVGDSCPQITTYQSGGGMPLVLQDPLATYPDIGHARRNFVKQFNNGAMNGWPNTGGINSGLTYFGVSQIPFYYQLANTYGLEDNHFSTLGGPSAPNHLYMFSASSNELSNNPESTQDGTGSPGENPLFTHPWTCGALHTGTSAPYLYRGTFPSTLASDGIRYYGGTCSNDRTIACTCTCPAGTTCDDTFDPMVGGKACLAAKCASVGNMCDTSFSLGGTAGAPCPTVTTIADVAEANGVSWGYYSGSPQWNAALYSQGIYFNPARLANHVHSPLQFDTDAAACTGMCSNKHSMACTLDAQCGAGSCVDSDGSSAGSTACVLPQITYLSPTQASNSDHPNYGSMSAGENWTKDRLASYFANPYVYYHSIVLLTWDDWGGYYDHVPPPVQDSVPTLGFRVPLLCIGPYCRKAVTHTQMEFASTLKCIETVFRLPAINSRDATATDACAGKGTLSHNTDGMVDLSQSPIPAIGQSLHPTNALLQSSLDPSIYGQTVTLTANVTSSSGTPSGTVTFFDGGSSIGTRSLSQGSASISGSAFGGGTHSMTASYSGDPLFASSSSNAVSQLVNPAASTATVQSSQPTSPYGLPVTITAVITGAGSAGPTGQVTFYDGTTSLATLPLSNSNATLASSTLSVGSHSITAQYGGDSNYVSSSSSPLVITIGMGITSTMLTSSPNPSTYNQSVAFTANATSPGGTPTGSVTFNDGTATLGIVALTNGTTTLNYSPLTAAAHNITASYGGDPNFQPSASAPLTQTVGQATTTTALTSSLNPSNANQSVTFTATVTTQFGGPVTGSVTFKQGTTTLSTVPLTNGRASYSSSFSAGTLSITAAYSGDSNNQTSTSAPMTQTVGQASTTTALTSNLNPSSANQSVIFTATATSQFGGPVTGSVTFKQGATTLAAVPLTNGQASYSSSFSAGTFSITAVYSGDSSNQTSTSASLSQMVNQAVTSTSLVSSLNPSVVNQPVTFTARVTSQFGGAVTGSVTFTNYVNNTTLVIATVPLTNGQASCPKTFTGAGPHLLTATYSGDSNNQTSTSASLSQMVNRAVTSTSLVSSLNPSVFNQSVTLTATVTSQFGGAVTESVTFTNKFNNSTTVIATVPLNGQASCTKTFTGAGAHSITATYSGDSNNLGSTSSIVSQIVNLDPTTTALSSSLNPSTSGQPVTFKATVSSTFGPIPDGELVTFFDGTVQLAPVPLAAGVATYTTSSLGLGQHTIKATYGGDSTFASSSKSLTQTVN